VDLERPHAEWTSKVMLAATSAPLAFPGYQTQQFVCPIVVRGPETSVLCLLHAVCVGSVCLLLFPLTVCVCVCLCSCSAR
jgi:hypothetical protein